MKFTAICLLFIGSLSMPVIAFSQHAKTSGDISWITTFPDSVESYTSRLEQLNQLLLEQPENANLYLKRGAINLGLHEFDQSIDDFTQAINKGDMDEAYFGRGMARGRLQDHEAAIADMDIYIGRHPESSVAYTKRGIRKLWNADREAAKADFIKAIELDSANAEANDDLGVIYAQEGDYQRAISHFKSTIHIDPTYHKAYHNLAMAYYLTDQNLIALATVDQGMTLVPGSRDSLLLKAEILKALGQQERAQELIDEAEFMNTGNWSERAPVQ